MSTAARPILIDTCVLLEDPNVIVRIKNKNGIPFLTGTVLDELDYNKKGDGEVNKNARAIVRELNKTPSIKVQNLPTGESLIQGDLLTRFEYEGIGIFLLTRPVFKEKTNNDGKIIELAQDYGMLLLTRDGGMKLRADGLGVKVVLWTGPVQTPSPDSDTKRASASSSSSNKRSATNSPVVNKGNTSHSKQVPVDLKPFNLPTSPLLEKDQACPVKSVPSEGGIVALANGQKFQLGPLISEGGEGKIYQAANVNMVCKIYHTDKLTILRRKKIELMVTRKVQRTGICWPTDIVFNENGEFLGYLMPRAVGKTVQSSMFVKAVLEKTFPQWTRSDLINLCIAFLEHIRYLHDLNIIVGDINPLNLLVGTDSSKLWIVDTDSFQVENFACPVGTVNFTAPEIQGVNYANFLRTKQHELFAVATMLFMLLHPGKPPYSQQGGGSPADNIKAMDFPYWFRKDNDEYSGKNAPHGPWQLIWSNLPYHMKEAFHNTFRANKRTNIEEWLRAFKKYKHMLSQGQTTDEIFPISFRIREPVEVACGKCSKPFTASKPWVEKLVQEGKQAWCPACHNRVKLERLANQSMRDTNSATKQTSHTKSSTYGSTYRARPTQTNTSGKSPGTGSKYTPPPRKQPVSPVSSGGGILSTLFKIFFN